MPPVSTLMPPPAEHELSGERARTGDRPLQSLAKLVRARDPQRHRLGRDHVLQRTPCWAG